MDTWSQSSSSPGICVASATHIKLGQQTNKQTNKQTKTHTIREPRELSIPNASFFDVRYIYLHLVKFYGTCIGKYTISLTVRVWILWILWTLNHRFSGVFFLKYTLKMRYFMIFPSFTVHPIQSMFVSVLFTGLPMINMGKKYQPTVGWCFKFVVWLLQIPLWRIPKTCELEYFLNKRTITPNTFFAQWTLNT